MPDTKTSIEEIGAIPDASARRILYALDAEVTRLERRIRLVKTSMRAGAMEDHTMAKQMYRVALRTARDWAEGRDE